MKSKIIKTCLFIAFFAVVYVCIFGRWLLIGDSYYQEAQAEGDAIAEVLWAYHKEHKKYPQTITGLDIHLKVTKLEDWGIVTYDDFPDGLKINITLKGPGYLQGISEMPNHIEWSLHKGK